MQRFRGVAASLAAAAVVILLAACGGTGSGGGAAAGRLASPEDDKAAAARMLLTAADLPGYDLDASAGAPAGADPLAGVDPSSLQAASTFEACAGAAAALDDERMAQSPGFFKGRTILVSSLAVVAADETAARKAMEDLGRADIGGCLTVLFRAVLGLDLFPGTAATTDLLPSAGATAAKGADHSATWRTTLQVAIGGQTVPAYSDLTFLRTGRAVAVLFDFQVGEPFPTAERNRLAGTVAGRLTRL